MLSTFHFSRYFEKDQPVVPSQQAVSHRACKPHQQGRFGTFLGKLLNLQVKASRSAEQNMSRKMLGLDKAPMEASSGFFSK